MLTIEHIAEVLKSAVVPYDVRAVYLFGSFARGEAGPQSDADVRLECDLEIDYADLLDIQESLGGTWAVLSRWWPTPLSLCVRLSESACSVMRRCSIQQLSAISIS